MKHISVLLSVLLLAGLNIYADETAPKKVLTLKECVNIAVENNTSIKAAEEDRKKALADYRVATAQRLLSIDMNLKTDGYPKTNIPTRYTDAYQWLPYLPTTDQIIGRYVLDKAQPQPSPFIKALTRDYDLGITLGVTASISLYSEKKTRNQEFAKKNLDMSKLQNKKAIGDVIYNVKNAYCMYLMAGETVVLKEKMLKSNKDKLRMTEILYKNAQRSVLDLSRAQYDFQNSQLELQKAKNGERAARTELFRIMGLDDPGTEFTLEDFNDLPQVTYTLEQLQKMAEVYSPDLQLAKIQTQVYKVRVDMERANHYPDVDLQVLGGLRNSRLDFTSFRNNFTSDAWKPSIGVNFLARMNLFSSGMITSRIASASADYNKSLYREKDIINATRTLVSTHYQSLQELSNMMELSKKLMQDAEKNMLLAKKSYESGAGTQLEINEAIMSYENAALGYQKSKNDYLMAVAKISSIVGLGEDSLCKK